MTSLVLSKLARYLISPSSSVGSRLAVFDKLIFNRSFEDKPPYKANMDESSVVSSTTEDTLPYSASDDMAEGNVVRAQIAANSHHQVRFTANVACRNLV